MTAVPSGCSEIVTTSLPVVVAVSGWPDRLPAPGRLAVVADQ